MKSRQIRFNAVRNNPTTADMDMQAKQITPTVTQAMLKVEKEK